MSVRRLAEDTVQPASFAFSDENTRWADGVIGRYPEGRQQSAVIPLLMRAQEQDGWVTKAAIEHIADKLRMPLIRVLEVATFYTQFQLKPVGAKAHVQVCGTTPCMLRGSDSLKEVCSRRIHHDQFHLNEAGTLSWEEVECLGACVNAPMVMISKDTYEDLTPERLEAIIDAFERGEGADVPAGPQIDRQLSAPFGGATTLLSEDGHQGARGEAGSGPVANGAGRQEGAGNVGSFPPSQAARPDTHAAETDPTIDAAGKGTDGNGNAHQGEEAANKVDVAEGANRPGAGRQGGTKQGPTGASEKDKDATDRGTASKDADTARRDGQLGEKGHAAEEAVVPDNKHVDPVDHASEHGVPASDEHRRDAAPTDGEPPRPPRRDADEAGAGRSDRADAEPTRADKGIAPPVEAKRLSDDTSSGPTAEDALATNEAADAPRGAARTTPSGSLETTGPKPIGQKPSGLLEAPAGDRDDLKRIKGVGPVIERTLNDLGVFHFRQIAAWSAEELVWIDDHINFHGRAIRDRWIEQAQALDGQRGSGNGE